MTASVPFRDTFWNVPGWAQIALYVGGVIAIAIFVYGMWQRVTLWRRGLPENRLDRIPERLGRVLTHALAGVSRRHARDHVLGLPGPVHGDGAGHARLGHHAATLRLQAPEGPVLPLLRDRARHVRALLRHRARDGGLAPVRRAPGAGRRDRTVRVGAHPALRHQRHGVHHGGLPAGGRRAVVGAVVAGGLGARPRLRGARPRPRRAPRPAPRDVGLPRRAGARLHRGHPVLLLRSLADDTAQHLLLE